MKAAKTSVHPKVMLEALMTRGRLNPSDKDMVESMWDQLHRLGKVSFKQGAWIEKRYHDQGLDRPDKPKPTSKVGSLNYEGATGVTTVSSIEQFRRVCPKIVEGSDQYKKIEAFFKKNPGSVIKVKPPGA